MLHAYDNSTASSNADFVTVPTVTATANCTVRIVSVQIIDPWVECSAFRFPTALPIPRLEHRRPVALTPSRPRTPAATWHRFIQRRREA